MPNSPPQRRRYGKKVDPDQQLANPTKTYVHMMEILDGRVMEILDSRAAPLQLAVLPLRCLCMTAAANLEHVAQSATCSQLLALGFEPEPGCAVVGRETRERLA